MQNKYRSKMMVQKLGCLIEECGEVLAAVGKAQRWGMESVNPELIDGDPFYEETNREWILRELNDLERAVVMVRRELTEEKS